MAKCNIIGKIRITTSVEQAIEINNLPCNKQTIWNLSGVGGESYVTDFTVTNNSSASISIEWEISNPTDSGYAVKILESDGITEVLTPESIPAVSTKSWKLEVSFDLDIRGGAYNILVQFDYV